MSFTDLCLVFGSLNTAKTMKMQHHIALRHSVGFYYLRVGLNDLFTHK